MTRRSPTEPSELVREVPTSTSRAGGGAPATSTVAYHRLARTPHYRRWRPLVEVVLAVVLWVGLGTAAYTALTWLAGTGGLFARDGALALAAVCVVLAMLVPSTLLAARWGGRRAAGTVSSVAGRLRWRWLGVCLLATFGFGLLYLVVVAPLALGALGALPPGDPTPIEWPGWSEFLPLAVLIVVLVPLQAAGEEYFFRGTLLQAIGAWTGARWIAIAITTAAFTLAHGTGLEASVAIACVAVMTAWLTIRTGGLEAAIALHAVVNVSGFLLLAAAGRADTWLATLNRDITWTMVAIDVVGLVAITAILARLADRRGATRTHAV